MSHGLEDLFHQAMIALYRQTGQETDYWPTLHLQMVTQHGGVEAAQLMVTSQQLPDGYSRLWELSRLDLSVEALILQPQWRPLFTDDGLQQATQRLAASGYHLPPGN
jgi:hypothetical protein